MRTSVLLAAAASALLLPLTGAGATGMALPNTDVLLLEAAGNPVSTTFATLPDVTYTVTVSGVYTYDGTLGLGLADCGHKDPEDATGWTNVANVLLDGRAARCSLQPFTPSHSYSWQQPGTGVPFTFTIFSNTYTGDDTGCLVVTVSKGVVPGTGAPRTCWRVMP